MSTSRTPLDTPTRPCILGYMATTVLIRTNITNDEWRAIRTIAITRGVPASVLVAQTLRESLLKGAKP